MSSEYRMFDRTDDRDGLFSDLMDSIEEYFCNNCKSVTVTTIPVDDSQCPADFDIGTSECTRRKLYHRIKDEIDSICDEITYS